MLNLGQLDINKAFDSVYLFYFISDLFITLSYGTYNLTHDIFVYQKAVILGRENY